MVGRCRPHAQGPCGRGVSAGNQHTGRRRNNGRSDGQQIWSRYGTGGEQERNNWITVRQQGESLTMQNQCAEIKLRAERRGGGLLKDREKHPGGRPAQNLSDDRTGLPTLPDLGITRNQSSSWQKIAAMPERDFERHIAETKQTEKELTTATLCRALARPPTACAVAVQAPAIAPESMI